jgi:hypothetical protein
MTSYSSFERQPSGAYATIEQHIDPEDIGPSAIYVAFDSIAFARATGQLGQVIATKHGTLNNASFVQMYAGDARWICGALVDTQRRLLVDYKEVGPGIELGLTQHHGNPYSNGYAKVIQTIGNLTSGTYIADGPMLFMGRDQAILGPNLIPGAEAVFDDSGNLIELTHSEPIDPPSMNYTLRIEL